MTLWRIYEQRGKHPLIMIGTVVANNAEDAVARARAGNWDKRFTVEGPENPEVIVAIG